MSRQTIEEWGEENGGYGRCKACGTRTWIESGCAPVCMGCEMPKDEGEAVCEAPGCCEFVYDEGFEYCAAHEKEACDMWWLERMPRDATQARAFLASALGHIAASPIPLDDYLRVMDLITWATYETIFRD